MKIRPMIVTMGRINYLMTTRMDGFLFYMQALCLGEPVLTLYQCYQTPLATGGTTVLFADGSL